MCVQILDHDTIYKRISDDIIIIVDILCQEIAIKQH